MIKKEKVSSNIIKNIGKEYICSICYENLKLNDSMICLECNHIFHYKCIEMTIDKNILKCPLCRRNIRNIDINNNVNMNNNNYRINQRNIYNNQNNHNNNRIREVNNIRFLLEISKFIMDIATEIYLLLPFLPLLLLLVITTKIIKLLFKITKRIIIL